MLERYAERFDTVELNTTFYRLPSQAAVRGWRDRTPDGFLFAAKMSRLATHYHRLRRPEDVATFVERLAPLGDKLGPVLVQLPPSLPPDLPRLTAFLDLFPPGQKVAVEFRDRGWLTSRTFKELEARSCAVCLVDGDERYLAPATADFAYVRWHGRGGAAYSYSDEEIGEWADLLDRLPVRDVYGYWNNDLEGAAPRNAQRMMDILRPRLIA